MVWKEELIKLSLKLRHFVSIEALVWLFSHFNLESIIWAGLLTILRFQHFACCEYWYSSSKLTTAVALFTFRFLALEWIQRIFSISMGMRPSKVLLKVLIINYTGFVRLRHISLSLFLDHIHETYIVFCTFFRGCLRMFILTNFRRFEGIFFIWAVIFLEMFIVVLGTGVYSFDKLSINWA